MATPVWFDSNAYIVNKAAQMCVDTLSALAAFKNAGWPTDAEGLYSHFVQYGKAEGVSPNSWFNNTQYLYGKAAAFYNTSTAAVTTQQLESMKAAMASIGMTPWDHYTAYWSENYVAGGKGSFHNPSVKFDANKYMADKLAQVQKTDATFTMDKLVDAFKASGLDPMSHYLAYGKGEDLTVSQVAGGTPGETFNLSLNADTVIGTAGNDYIKSSILGVANSLQNGDYIDGGAGQDTLYADFLTDDTIVTSPTIVDVETILFRTQNGAGAGGGSNYTTAIFDAENVTLTNASGQLTLGSDNSRADMRIEDVRWNSNQTTIRFSNTDPGDVDLSVYFDPQHLKSEKSVTTGTLYVQLIDTVGALDATQYPEGGHNDPLYDNPYTGFNFTFNGKDCAVSFGKYNHETDETPTYGELVKLIQDALDKAYPDLGLKVKTGDPFTATVGIGKYEGTSVTGTQIEISTDQGILVGGKWVAANGLPPTNSTSATFNTIPSLDCPLLVTNVELDNVGRVLWADANPDCLPDDIIYGSTAGDLLVGSMANRGGVERLDVTVDRGSWLSSISSTNDALRMITVKPEDINGDGASGGQLYIGDWLGKGDQLGDGGLATWTDAAKLLSFTAATGGNTPDAGSGLKDVAVFDATGYKGDINVAAAITSASFDKYFKSVDGGKYIDKMYAPLADEAYKGAFSYITGEGNDVINMSVNGSIAADVDFKMNINTGAGNDLVAFRYEAGMTQNQADNQKHLGNVTINTGDGNDTVWFYASASGAVAADAHGGSVIINAGAGNDTIYANQQDLFTGGKTGGNSGASGPNTNDGIGAIAHDKYNAVFVFNTSDTSIVANGLAGATLNNDNAVGAHNFTVGTPTANETIKVSINFKGHVVTGVVKNVNTSLTSVSAEEVNHAIIDAIANDPVLSKLLVAKDGAAHALLIESIINGEMSLSDLAIKFYVEKADGSAGSTTFNTGTWYNTEFATDKVNPTFKYDGNDTTNSQVIVDGGAGDDVIVLGSNGTLSDIVKVGPDSGNDTLIGFVAGVDKISLAGVLNAGKALETGVTATTLKANGAAIVAAAAPKAKTGIYTQDEVNKMVTDKALAFATDAKANDAAVVMLESKDAAGNYVYTLVKMVAGTTATGTVLGSYTMDAKGGAHTQLTVGDLISDLVLRDSSTGITYSEYKAGIAGLVPSDPAGSFILNGGIFNDTFNKLSTDTLNQAGTGLSGGISAINGGFGNDTFNIVGALGATHDLFGDGGVDTFNFTSAALTYAVAADVNGGDGNDVFNITNTATATVSNNVVTFSGELNGGAGNDVFTFKSIAGANSQTGAVTTIAAIDGGADVDSASFLFDLGAFSGGSATYTVTSMLGVENITVGKNVIANLTFAADTETTELTTVTINVDQAAVANNLAALTMVNNSANAKVVYHVTGGEGIDTLVGGDGNDILDAGAGTSTNTITGGKGDDTIILRSTGIDTVKFSSRDDNGTDTITGFEVGTTKDVLNIKDLGFSAITGGALVDASASSRAIADDTVYYVKLGSSVAIGGKDYAGSDTDFGTLFGTGKNFTGITASQNALIVIQGTDKSYVYHVASTDSTLDKSDLKLVGVLADVDSADTLHVDNFSAA